MLPTKFRFIWPSSFRDFFRNGHPRTRIAYGSHVC